MAGLTEFLTARLDEDEAKAQAVVGSYPSYPWGLEEVELVFMERWNPAAVLADIAAKRLLLAPHRPTRADDEYDDTLMYPQAANLCQFCGPGDHWSAREFKEGDYAWWPCKPVRIMASVYRDHAEFREEWA